MTADFTTPEGEPILVQFSEARGMQPVSISGEELAKKSAEALEKAMGTIRQMADRVAHTMRQTDLADRPAQVEIEFGLTLDAEAGALIAKVATQAGFKVKLVWKHQTPETASTPEQDQAQSR